MVPCGLNENEMQDVSMWRQRHLRGNNVNNFSSDRSQGTLAYCKLTNLLLPVLVVIRDSELNKLIHLTIISLTSINDNVSKLRSQLMMMNYTLHSNKNVLQCKYRLTLILLKPKMISNCHQYRARPCTAHTCSLTRLNTVGWPTSNSHLDTPTFDNG